MLGSASCTPLARPESLSSFIRGNSSSFQCIWDRAAPRVVKELFVEESVRYMQSAFAISLYYLGNLSDIDVNGLIGCTPLLAVLSL